MLMLVAVFNAAWAGMTVTVNIKPDYIADMAWCFFVPENGVSSIQGQTYHSGQIMHTETSGWIYFWKVKGFVEPTRTWVGSAEISMNLTVEYLPVELKELYSSVDLSRSQYEHAAKLIGMADRFNQLMDRLQNQQISAEQFQSGLSGIQQEGNSFAGWVIEAWHSGNRKPLDDFRNFYLSDELYMQPAKQAAIKILVADRIPNIPVIE